ncbi:MAG: hypothetical protein WAK57_02185, partial [Desulfobacterales bacterium]
PITRHGPMPIDRSLLHASDRRQMVLTKKGRGNPPFGQRGDPLAVNAAGLLVHPDENSQSE